MQAMSGCKVKFYLQHVHELKKFIHVDNILSTFKVERKNKIQSDTEKSLHFIKNQLIVMEKG